MIDSPHLGASTNASVLTLPVDEFGRLRGRVAVLDAENARLREALATAEHLQTTNVHDLAIMRESHAISSLAAVASGHEITRGRAELASSRAEIRVNQSELVASIVALALSRKETNDGQSDLAASELVNKTLSIANALLVTSEATLEKLVEERTAALTREVEDRRRAEETLRQGEKMQALGQITGGIAHDFNNLLQVVVTGVGLLRHPTLSEARRVPVLDKIDYAAESAAALISRLLIFSRKQTLRPQAFDLNERVVHVFALLKSMLGPGISLETDLASDLWPVMADPSQLDIAILNVAVNARDAMLPAEGTLTFRTHNVVLDATSDLPAGDYVSLGVQDTGPGMLPAVLANVFEPFFTTKPEGKGTGLGLPQVYSFAKQSGGEVTIKSAPGHGTAVLFHLPRAGEESRGHAAKQAEMETRSNRLVAHTVLVVEDNPDLASFTAAMLEEQGYLTERASNAAEALALLDGGTPVDGVFSDIVMPGPMNGLQLASTLRLRYPNVAVVLATGYSQSLSEGNGSSAAEVLSKPYRRHDLGAALERAFTAIDKSRLH